MRKTQTQVRPRTPLTKYHKSNSRNHSPGHVTSCPVYEGHQRFAVTFVDGYVIFLEAETLESAAALAVKVDYSDISKVATVTPVVD